VPVRALTVVALAILLVTVAGVMNVADAIPPRRNEMAQPLDGTSWTGRIFLEAQAPAGVTKVEFRATGGGLRNTVVAVAKKLGTYYWLAYWNSSAAHPGSYLIWSVDYTGSARSSGRSPTINITIRS
jgi:hypothetical protein